MKISGLLQNTVNQTVCNKLITETTLLPLRHTLSQSCTELDCARTDPSRL